MIGMTDDTGTFESDLSQLVMRPFIRLLTETGECGGNGYPNYKLGRTEK